MDDKAANQESRFRHVRFVGVPVAERAHRRMVNRIAAVPSQQQRSQSAAPRAAVLRLQQQEDVPPEAGAFIRWLLDRGGVDASSFRMQPLLRRLPACLRALRVSLLGQAQAMLLREPQLLPVALDAMVIGVTEFFRDPAVFQMLAEEVLPEIGQAGRRGLRVWSVGCSEGAELYSVAILLAEAGLLGASELLGTDCREQAIAQARSGYASVADATKGVPPMWLTRYFVQDGARLRVGESLREMTRWQLGDVLLDARADAPGQWDLILCRNMAIYLRPEAAAALWRKLTAALRPGGVLVTGKAERPGTADLARIGPCLYRKAGARGA